MKAHLRESIVIPFVLNQASSDVRVMIMRLSDGYWLDFNDSTFKNSGWTQDYGAMTQDSNNVWSYAWTTPKTEDKYQTIFIDQDTGFQYTGPVIEVAGNTMFTVQSDAGNSATTFKTDLPDSVNNYYKLPSLVKMISGNVAGQVCKLATSGSFDGTTKFIAVDTGFSATPDAGSRGIIINV